MSSVMSSVLLIGGNGQLARCITKRFSCRGINVYSVIRNQNQVSELKDLGALPIVQSVEDSTVSEFVTLIKDVKPDVVIWSAGAGAGSASNARIKRVDNEGHIKVMDAVAQAAEEAKTTRRYITISSLDVRDVNKPVPDWYNEEDRKFSNWLSPIFKRYFEARLISDRSLVEGNGRRHLDYTILRPGWMSQERGTGRIGAGRCRISGPVSREDVTTVLELCLESDSTIGLAFDIAGGDIPIKEAIENVEDSFQGYY
ncbi:NAD-dependent epimerase dehydratase protein [Rutstroemia sp. NJR-2017a BVV2]|nr:NAD-dependent epimerase dehydratase protein [Rutstroemia sp. NJR-2017a BVV2]